MKKWLVQVCFLMVASMMGQDAGHGQLRPEALSPERILQDYIRIPSESGQESKAGAYLRDLCLSFGLHITQMGDTDGNYNFMASLFRPEEGLPNIILLNHIDVVPESDENKHGSYSGHLEDGRLYGRGTFDNKGPAVMQLMAINRLKEQLDLSNSPFNVSLLSVSCEETQCDGGTAYVVDNYWSQLNPAVVIGEGPTEVTELITDLDLGPIFAVSRATKRVYWLELELEIPISAHGSVTPQSYANKELVAALDRLTRKKPKAVFNEVNTKMLEDMAEYRKGMERFVLRHPRFFKPVLVPQLRKTPELFALFTNTITLTVIQSNSETVNSNATAVRAGLDCRLFPNADEEEFLQKLRKRLKNDSIEIRTVKLTPRNKPSDVQNLFYESLDAAIKENYPGASTLAVMMPNINDLGHFRARGIPSYGSIPISITRKQMEGIHGDDENISIDALHEGIDTYFLFLSKLVLSNAMSPEESQSQNTE